MKTLTIILSALFLFSCKPKQVTIEGRLMADCNVPLANQSGTIHQKGMYAGKVADFTSDENGYFKAVFEPKGHGNICRIALEGGGTILEEIRFTEYTELGEVYANPPSVRYYLLLDVQNAYTELDTIHYRNCGAPQDGRPSWLKKAGPFQSGIIDTVHFALNLGAMPIDHERYNLGIYMPTLLLDYYINEYDSGNRTRIEISTPYCVEEYQNVSLVIE